jgi:hypothetical protein
MKAPGKKDGKNLELLYMEILKSIDIGPVSWPDWNDAIFLEEI